jgi:hypothetical protein
MPISIAFCKMEWLTIAQLMCRWALELGEKEQDLTYILLLDAVNGRLDDAGPLRDGQRSGLRIITSENKAGFIKGRFLHDLQRTGELYSALDRIVVMKEAILVFAALRELPAPSWWANNSTALCHAATTDAHSTTTHPTSTITDPAKRRGRRRKKGQAVEKAMREDIEQGRLTIVELSNMLEKNLVARYGVSRETARKARDAVLSEMSAMTELPPTKGGK